MFFPKASILLLLPLAVSGRTSRVRGVRRLAQDSSDGGSSRGGRLDLMPYSRLKRARSGSGKGKSSKSSKSSKNDGGSGSDYYHADFGDFGEFYLDVTNRGTMSWELDLEDLDDLEDMLNVSLASLTYHLHTEWGNTNETYATGAGCGADTTGGHYDPFFACGPASAVPTDTCETIGKPDDDYNCNTTIYWDDEKYDQCAVGDLSGKDGPVEVDDGTASVEVDVDYLPAIQYHYANITDGSNLPSKFASVVVHNADGGARILCGKLELIEGSGTSKSSKGSSMGKGKGKGGSMKDSDEESSSSDSSSEEDESSSEEESPEWTP